MSAWSGGGLPGPRRGLPGPGRCLPGLGGREGVCLVLGGGVCLVPGGGIPACTEADPPMNRMNDRQV